MRSLTDQVTQIIESECGCAVEHHEHFHQASSGVSITCHWIVCDAERHHTTCTVCGAEPARLTM